MAKKARQLGADEFRDLIDRSMEELRAKTRAHTEGWGLGTCDGWDLDQQDGRLVFTSPKLTATAPAQIIGTYSTQAGTWLWGWDHPSIRPPLQKDAKKVRDFGEQNGIDVLTTQKLECTEKEAWEFTALACHLCGAQGGYRGPAGQALVFMTFGEVTLSKGKG
jgi:hypothetical protein